MKALNVIETAYRGTLEEQDDTIIWFTHALRGAGAEVDVLLRGNAVNYAVRSQMVAPLKFGTRQQKHGPQITRDLSGLVEKGCQVLVLSEDLAERGIAREELIDGVRLISRDNRAALYDLYPQVWQW